MAGALVWVASYPRSGNTWLRIFLHNVLRLTRGEAAAEIDELDQYSTWDIADRWYVPLLDKPTNEATKEEVAAVRPLAQRSIADSVDGLIFVKTHAALVMDRTTPTIDTSRTAGAVYVVRNPLDVAVSYAKHLDLSLAKTVEILNTPRYETANGPHSVYEFYGSWSQHVLSWTRRPHRAIFVVRYEDMLAEPIHHFGRLVAHLNIPATAEQVEEAAGLSSFARLKDIETKQGFRERPKQSRAFFRRGAAGLWRHDMPADLVQKVTACHGEVMRTFGYLS